jgi:IS30 family transposase
LLRKVEHRRADLVSDAVIDLLQPVADRSHTITGDNGNLFAEHEIIARELGIDFFFAHPYGAWERGVNKKINVLGRQYIPKNRDIESVTDDELLKITSKLNHRPGKCLDFRTFFDVFFEQPVALTS